MGPCLRGARADHGMLPSPKSRGGAVCLNTQEGGPTYLKAKEGTWAPRHPTFVSGPLVTGPDSQVAVPPATIHLLSRSAPLVNQTSLHSRWDSHLCLLHLPGQQPGHMVQRRYWICQKYSNVFFSETVMPIEAKCCIYSLGKIISSVENGPFEFGWLAASANHFQCGKWTI
ncbi:UNVERIFIED_CONTAM: hypothetical protein FKN15_060359 [Acipenser sinensis]